MGAASVVSVDIERVTVDFKIYGAQKSFRKALFARATGGTITRDTDRIITVRALDDVSVQIRHGDRLGVLGHNGAGKTTFLRVAAGVYQPTQGNIRVEGRLSPLFTTAPGLDMDDTGYENVYNCGMFLGMSRNEINQNIADIEAFAELGEYMNLPVRTYSAGMLVRLTFAIATCIHPEILILDEGLSAGDARFAERAKQRVDALIERAKILIIASHSDALIEAMCNRAILLRSGRIVADGSVAKVSKIYKHLCATGYLPGEEPVSAEPAPAA
jgi:ABC-type polysaccharide/polyol phosphate transport system ATPase subunit